MLRGETEPERAAQALAKEIAKLKRSPLTYRELTGFPRVRSCIGNLCRVPSSALRPRSG